MIDSCIIAAVWLIVTAIDNAAEWGPARVATVIFGVLAITAIFAWMMWGLYRFVSRAESDVKFRRRVLLWTGIIYCASAAFGILLVLTGHEPVQSLVGLPIAALLIWTFLRAAMKVKVPPT